jgi:phage I-like protein
LSQVAGYWVDLKGVQLSYEDGKSWIQALPLGSYNHPIWGTINVTPDRVAQFVENIKLNVRDTDLDVDYDHKAKDGRAAGWVRDAQDRGTEGLWIQVEWTQPAKDAIAAGEYRYFSPEFADEWTHPKTKQTYKDVLFGGALTNRPFLKDILPVNLSEIVDSYDFSDNQSKEEEQVDESLKKLRETLKLSEDTPEDKVFEALAGELEKANKASEGQPQQSQGDDELKKLAEDNPVIAKLLADREEDAKKLAILETAHRMSEVTRQLTEVNTKKTALPPVVTDQLKTVLMQLPVQLSDKIVDVFKKLSEIGFVQLGEEPARTGAKGGTDGADDATTAYMSKVAELMDKNSSMSFSEAAIEVSRQDPQLWAAYNDAVYQGANV